MSTTDQIRCGILGCGAMFPRSEKRIYDPKFLNAVCCPGCWDAMEIPREYRDTEEYKRAREAERKEATPTGCPLDTDGDGNCPIHPQGCPRGEEGA